MSSYDEWQQRVMALRAALPKLKKAPTGGGVPPGASLGKPPDARGAVVRGAAHPREVLPALPMAKTVDAPRALSLSQKQLRADRRRDLRLNGPAEPVVELDRPKTRGDCEGGDRPCPFVGCRYHTYLDVGTSGTLKLNRPDQQPEDVQPEASCALDVADRGGITLDQVGGVMNITRERTRQIETQALQKLAVAVDPERAIRFRSQCKALCADTGLRCGLLEHGAQTHHRTARGEFYRAAAPGQASFPRKDRLDAAAVRGISDPGATHV